MVLSKRAGLCRLIIAFPVIITIGTEIYSLRIPKR